MSEGPNISRSRLRRVLEYLAIVAVVVMMAGFVGHGRLAVRSNFEQADTTVWYCAGQAVNAHADPYLVEPLRSCEIANEPDHSRKFPWVEPAPLPGYALAAFAGLAHLPFALFRTFWFYVLVAAVVLSAAVLAKLARIPLLLALLCLAVVDARVNLFYGELPPLAVAVLVAAAALGAARRYSAAGLIAAVAMIEPHIGLPACLAMFVWWPQTRPAFCALAVVFAGAAVATLGLHANVEYFTTLLPVHAAAEIAAADQYSLSRVLHILGFSDKLALGAGSASYLVMTGVGVLLARRVARAVDAPGLVVLLPPALALFGGPFVHDLQIAAAIPAALVLAASPRPPLPLRAGALVALVVPWHSLRAADVANQGGFLVMAAIAAAVLVATSTRSIRVRALSACAAVVVVVGIGCGIGALPQHKVGPPTTIAVLAVAPGDLSSADWAASVSRDRSYTTPDARDVAEKIPVWLALVTLLAMSMALAWKPLPRSQPMPAATASVQLTRVRQSAAVRPLLFP